MPKLDIDSLLDGLSKPQRARLFDRLREEFPIHPLELDWNVSAEVVLEAIARSSDLTRRMFRGILAEAAFKVEVVDELVGWKDVTPPGAHSYDFQLRKGRRSVRVQVKLQRRLRGEPMTADRAAGLHDPGLFVVETQKTRAGKDRAGGDTRPYRFDDFDVLAVCMEPATGEWEQFRFVPTSWLLARAEAPELIAKYQPVSLATNADWTDTIGVCIERYLSGEDRTIANPRQQD